MRTNQRKYNIYIESIKRFSLKINKTYDHRQIILIEHSAKFTVNK